MRFNPARRQNMLDIKYIKANKVAVKKMVTDRQKFTEVDIDRLIEIDDEKSEIYEKLTSLRQKRNEIDEKIKFCKDPTEREQLIVENTKLKPEVQDLDTNYRELEEKATELLWKVPNIMHPEVPIGKDENENKVWRKIGEPRKFDFDVKDHMELGKLCNLIDTDKSAMVSGSRFNYLFGEAAILQFAIVMHVFHTLTNPDTIADLAKRTGNPFNKPFIPVVPPVIAKSEIMKKMDRFDPIEDRYYYAPDDVLFIGSAEHTLGPLHMNEIIDDKKLPIRYIGYSTAFRREAGAYGKDAAGILRRHQFDKLEMETFIHPEYGEVEQDLIIAIQEYLVSSLQIPYQVIKICSGDMGKPDYRQIDVECYLPGQGKYRETHTSDYMTDFQSRRLNIKYKTKEGVKGYVHMNDATAFAIGRIIIAILENNQQKDGSVVMPEVLHKYLGFEVIRPKP